jgi:ubiquinone/menaquinone biosynthesis C-methylase UbiE
MSDPVAESTAMKDPRERALETYFRLMTMNGGARVFRTAQELKLLDALGPGPTTADALARACGTQAVPTGLVLDALAAMGILQPTGQGYVPAPVARFLTGNYRDLGDLYWEHLPQLLKTGVPLMAMDALAQSERCYQTQAAALEWMVKPSAEAAATLLSAGRQQRYANVLDVGAGSAVWSLTLVRHNPAMRVTALDWPAVLELAHAAAQRAGLEDRFSVIAGNYHEVDLPVGTYDLAIVANVAHLETPEGNVSLFRRVHRALQAGGEMAIIDIFPGQPAGDLARTLYMLGLALRTEKGRVYRAEELNTFLRQTGFEEGTVTPLVAPPFTLGMLRGRKAS